MKLIETKQHTALFNAVWMRYVTAAAIAVASAQLQSEPCTPTKAATPGETVWVIADRIQGIVGGATSPDIVNNPRVIDQSLIPYTITESGRYILCEDLTAQAGDSYAIWIQASDVTLDLNKHAIFKQSHSQMDERDIILVATEGEISNIIIQNGRLVQTSGSDVAGATLNGIHGITIQNVLLKNLEIFGASPNLFTFNGTKLRFSQAITISDVKTDSVTNGFLFDGTSNLVLRDCDAVNSRSVGFTVEDTVSNSRARVLRRCRATTSFNQGFVVRDTSDVFLDKCISQDSLVGFDILGDPTQLIYCKQCCALSNSQYGFRVGFFPPFGSATNHCGFFECVSSDNGLDGFALLSTSGSTFHSVYRCTAARNNTANLLTSYGFNINSGSSFNVYNNLGYRNNNGDFNGVPGAAVFSSENNLGPSGSVNPTNMTGILSVFPSFVFVTNDFWPNLRT